MKSLTSRFTSFGKSVCYVFCVVLVTGCSSIHNGSLNSIKPAGFRLHDVTVSWEDNTELPVNMQYKTFKSQAGNPPPEQLQKMVLANVKNIVQLLRSDATRTLGAELEKAGVHKGTSYRIILRPFAVSRSTERIFGTSVYVSVTVLDQTGEKLWSSNRSAYDDMSMISSESAKPSATYVSNLIDGIMQAFRKAEMIN